MTVQPPLDIAASRQGRFARVLSLTDRILCNRVETIDIVTQGEAPAWTDGKTIWLNASKLPSLVSADAGALAVWLGANYHELGHVMYSPRSSSPLSTQVLKATRTFAPGAHRAENILEDQRQERLMIAQFSPLRAYFTAMGTKVLVGGPAADIGESYCLLAGRTWLPADVRAMARRKFVEDNGEEQATELDAVISAYQKLGDPGYTQSDAAYNLVLRFIAALGGNTNVPKDQGCEWAYRGTEGEDESAETDDVDTPEDIPMGPSDGDDESDEDGADGGPGAGEGTDTGATDTDSDTGADGGTGGGNDDESQVAGSGAGSTGTVNEDDGADMGDLRDALEDALTDMLKDDDVADDLDAVKDALDTPLKEGAQGRDAQVYTVRPTAEQALEARRVEDAMRDITDAAEARHIRGVEHGRLNVARYTTSQRFDPDTMFDRFEPAQEDETSIEVVVLLDRSGSMGGSRMVAASGAVWAIQRAVETANGECTVLAYDTMHTIVQNKGERAPVHIHKPRAGGGTSPKSALVQALRILNESDAANRILVSVTDGAWYAGSETVELLRGQGVTTAMVLIDTYKFAPGADPKVAARELVRGANSHEHVVGSSDGTGIAKVFSDIAETMLKGALR